MPVAGKTPVGESPENLNRKKGRNEKMKMKRRFWAGLLAFVMLWSLLPASALAAKEDTPEPGKVTATKTASILNSDGTYTITLTVQGNPVEDKETTTTSANADVVLVVDNSGSMASSVGEPCKTPKALFKKDDGIFPGGLTKYTCPECKARYYSWDSPGIHHSNVPDYCTGEKGVTARINAAKNVGEEFAKSILKENSGNRLAVIGFAHSNRDGGTDNKAIKVSQDLTNNLTAVNGALDKMDADGGTNYTAALQKAYDFLNGRTQEEKTSRPGYVVFISDGAPGLSGDSQNDPKWNGADQVKSIKKDEYTLYTVGIALDKTAADYLKSMASDAQNDHFINVTDTNYDQQLSTILKQWADKITETTKKKPAGTNATLVDLINTDKFDYVVGSASKNLVVADDNKTVTWTIDKIPEKPESATFKIKAKAGVYGKDIPTNDNVTLTYTDAAGESVTKDKSEIGDPKVTIPATVTYVAYDVKDSNHPDVTIQVPAPAQHNEGDIVAVYASTIAPVRGTKDGKDGTWTFAGWTTEDAEIGNDGKFTMPAKNVTLTGTWTFNADEPLTYTLTYDANGGSFGTGEITKQELVSAIGNHPLNYTDDFTPSHVLQEGKDVIFLGWSAEKHEVLSTADQAAKIASDIITSVDVTANGATVYAVWSLDGNGNHIPDVFEATITYKIDNGEWTDNSGNMIGAAPIVANFELYTKQDDHSWKATDKLLRHGNFPIGYAHNEDFPNGRGWYRNDEETATTLVNPNTKVIDAVTGSETVFTYKYAGETAKTYTVVLHLEGGSYETVPSGYVETADGYQYTVQAKDTINPATPAMDGYDLKGWSLKDSAPENLIGANKTFAELYMQYIQLNGGGFGSDKIDLYAVWEKSVPAETVIGALNAHVFKDFQSTNSNSTSATFTATATVSMKNEPVVNGQVPEVVVVAEPLTYKGNVQLSTGQRMAFTFAGEDAALVPNTTYTVTVTEDTSDLPKYVTATNPTVSFAFTTDKNGKVICRDYEIVNTYNKSNDSGHDSDTYYLVIKKIDAQDGHALKDAKFGLYADDKQIATAISSSKGYARFSLDERVYKKLVKNDDLYVMELTAPDGYVKSSRKYDVSVNAFVENNVLGAQEHAITVTNSRSSTPDRLNDEEHFAYVIGYKDGNVRPYGLISRAETTTIFFRLLKDSVRDGNLLTSNTYTDVADSYWANTAISTMTGLGIVQGRTATTFDPYAPITRAQFAAICARFDDGKTQGGQTFTDIQGHWAQAYIERAAELGWIKGFEDGTFRPDTYITRAQAMTMINRVLNRIPEDADDLLSNMNVWPDCNPGDWFYLAVQEATNSHDYKHKAGNYETWSSMNKDPNWTRYEN